MYFFVKECYRAFLAFLLLSVVRYLVLQNIICEGTIFYNFRNNGASHFFPNVDFVLSVKRVLSSRSDTKKCFSVSFFYK
jgi:hypothetical protein